MKVTFYLNTRSSKTGERLIQTTLCANGYRLRLSTGLSVKPEDWIWNNEGQKKKNGGPFVRHQAPNATFINQRLDLIRVTMTYFEGTREEATTKHNTLLGKEARPKAAPTEKAINGENATLATAILREFEIKEGALCGWSESTIKKFKTLQNHLYMLT